MLRLGELLVAAHVLEPGKVEQALRAQVVWGGRLGTNLIELGFIDLDELSRALGRQHALPAALARHFDRANPELQAALPADLAERYSCVPLLHLADGKIALAAMDPIDDEGLIELGTAFGVAPSELVVSIAAEQRMRYQLERVYQLSRGARYLRTRGSTIHPFPVFGDFQDEADSDVEIPIDVELPRVAPREDDSMAVPIAFAGDDDPTTSFAVARTHSDELAAAIDTAVAGSSDPEVASGHDRRTYVKTLGDGGEDGTAPRPRPRPREPSRPKKALGRIAIKRAPVLNAPTVSSVAHASTLLNLPEDVIEARGSDEASKQQLPASLAEAAKHIRRSPDRDRVAELVIDAVLRFAPTAEATMLFVIRGGSATGWKSFCRSRPSADDASGTGPSELAVPMDQPGLFPQAVSFAKTCRACAGALGPLDAQLLAELEPAPSSAGPAGDRELAVVPIAIAGKVMCVLAVATAPGASLAAIETIATAAGTAFGRLMRDAGR